MQKKNALAKIKKPVPSKIKKSLIKEDLIPLDEMISEGKELYEQEQDFVGDIREKSSKAILLAFKIGKLIQELPKEYGSKTVAKFAEGCGFSEGTARDYHYLYRGAVSEDLLSFWENPNKKYFRELGHYIDGCLFDSPTTDAFRTYAHKFLLFDYCLKAKADEEYEPKKEQVRQISLYLKALRKRIEKNPDYEWAYSQAFVSHPSRTEFKISLLEPQALGEGDSSRRLENFKPVIRRFQIHLTQLMGIKTIAKGAKAQKTIRSTKGIFPHKGRGSATAASVNAVEDLFMNVDTESAKPPPLGIERDVDKVIFNDCELALKDEKLFPHRSISVVLTDPPYGQDYQGSSGYRPGRRNHFENPLTTEDAVKLVGRTAKLLRDREIMKEKFIWFSFFPIDRIHTLVSELLTVFDGLDVIHQVLVWDKEDGGMKLSCERYFRRDAEAILYFNVGRKTLSPELDGKSHRLHSSIFKYPSRSPEKAEFQFWKPPELLRHLIQLSTFRDNNPIILDPFAGRGSTGVASIQLDKDYRLIECDEGQHSIAWQAIRNARRKKSSQNG